MTKIPLRPYLLDALALALVFVAFSIRDHFNPHLLQSVRLPLGPRRLSEVCVMPHLSQCTVMATPAREGRV